MSSSLETINHIYDVLHFVAQAHEVRVVEFDWWTAKFKWEIKRASAARLWERLKAQLKDLAIPFELIDTYSSGESNCQKLAIKFKLPEAWDRVQELLGDEPGEHHSDRKTDPADNPVQNNGRKRHGDVSHGKVDSRKRAR